MSGENIASWGIDISKMIKTIADADKLIKEFATSIGALKISLDPTLDTQVAKIKELASVLKSLPTNKVVKVEYQQTGSSQASSASSQPVSSQPASSPLGQRTASYGFTSPIADEAKAKYEEAISKAFVHKTLNAPSIEGVDLGAFPDVAGSNAELKQQLIDLSRIKTVHKSTYDAMALDVKDYYKGTKRFLGQSFTDSMKTIVDRERALKKEIINLRQDTFTNPRNAKDNAQRKLEIDKERNYIEQIKQETIAAHKAAIDEQNVAQNAAIAIRKKNHEEGLSQIKEQETAIKKLMALQSDKTKIVPIVPAASQDVVSSLAATQASTIAALKAARATFPSTFEKGAWNSNKEIASLGKIPVVDASMNLQEVNKVIASLNSMRTAHRDNYSAMKKDVDLYSANSKASIQEIIAKAKEQYAVSRDLLKAEKNSLAITNKNPAIDAASKIGNEIRMKQINQEIQAVEAAKRQTIAAYHAENNARTQDHKRFEALRAASHKNELNAINKEYEAARRMKSQLTNNNRTSGLDTFAQGFIGGAGYASFQRIISGLQVGFERALAFEKQIALIQTISQKAQLTTNEWSNGIIKLSNSFGLDALETARGTYEAISNQVAQGAESFKFMEQAMKLAVTAGSTTREAVDALTGVMNAYHMSVSEANRISAILFKSVDLGRVTLDQMANAIGQIAVPASLLGVTFEELMAAVDTITIQGIKFDEVATQMRGMFAQLLKPGEDLKKTLKSFGFETGESMIKTLGFADAMGLLIDSFEGTSKAVADNFRNMRGMIGTMALAGDSMAQYRKVLGELKTSVKDYDEAFRLTMENNAKSVERQTTLIKNSFLTMGEQLLNVLGPLGKMFDGTAEIVHGLALVIGGTLSVAIITRLIPALKAGTSSMNLFASGAQRATLYIGLAVAAYETFMYFKRKDEELEEIEQEAKEARIEKRLMLLVDEKKLRTKILMEEIEEGRRAIAVKEAQETRLLSKKMELTENAYRDSLVALKEFNDASLQILQDSITKSEEAIKGYQEDVKNITKEISDVNKTVENELFDDRYAKEEDLAKQREMLWLRYQDQRASAVNPEIGFEGQKEAFREAMETLKKLNEFDKNINSKRIADAKTLSDSRNKIQEEELELQRQLQRLRETKATGKDVEPFLKQINDLKKAKSELEKAESEAKKTSSIETGLQYQQELKRMQQEYVQVLQAQRAEAEAYEVSEFQKKMENERKLSEYRMFLKQVESDEVDKAISKATEAKDFERVKVLIDQRAKLFADAAGMAEAAGLPSSDKFKELQQIEVKKAAEAATKIDLEETKEARTSRTEALEKEIADHNKVLDKLKKEELKSAIKNATETPLRITEGESLTYKRGLFEEIDYNKLIAEKEAKIKQAQREIDFIDTIPKDIIRKDGESRGAFLDRKEDERARLATAEARKKQAFADKKALEDFYLMTGTVKRYQEAIEIQKALEKELIQIQRGEVPAIEAATNALQGLEQAVKQTMSSLQSTQTINKNVPEIPISLPPKIPSVVRDLNGNIDQAEPDYYDAKVRAEADYILAKRKSTPGYGVDTGGRGYVPDAVRLANSESNVPTSSPLSNKKQNYGVYNIETPSGTYKSPASVTNNTPINITVNGGNTSEATVKAIAMGIKREVARGLVAMS